MHKWLLLTYKIPPEPSSRRVYIWRKLKRIGALLHQESCWMLPSNTRTQEQFQWLSAEIIEMGGEATLWEASLLLGAADETLKQKFIGQVDQPYLEIIDKLEKGEADLESLSRQYQQILSKDYFNPETGRRLREALLSMRGGES
ncbi:MAG TPA: Chromate resistance protein ChrB [Levilinea sp.]|nr:Chromate resistance protein ChrB [Levilinea sp.]